MTTEYKVYGRDDYGYYSRVCSNAAEVSKIVKSGTVEQVEKIDTNVTRWNGTSGSNVTADWEDNSEKWRPGIFAACVEYGGDMCLAICIEENVTEARNRIANYYGWQPTTRRIRTLRKIGCADHDAKFDVIRCSRLLR